MRNSATLIAVAFLVLAIFSHSGDRHSTAQVARIPNAIQESSKEQKWEYQLLRVPADDEGIENAGNRLAGVATVGWEVFQAVPQDRFTLLILKRPGK